MQLKTSQILFWMMALLFLVPGQSETLTVGGQTADFNSIQDAIYASEIGDTIEVYDGIYFTQLN